MATATTRRTEGSTKDGRLYMALELGQKQWKVAWTTGMGRKPRVRRVRGGDTAGLMRELERGRRRFGVGAECPVVSCYEAGRDGFWLHRFLESEGIENHVVDSSSIEVNRRRRRAKSDRLDAEKLVGMLIRYAWGDRDVWKVVRVPTVEEEDRRQLHRTLMTLKREQTRQVNRIRGLLASQGIRRRWRKKDGPDWFEKLELWDGSPVPPGLRRRLEQEYERLEMVRRQIRDLESERRKLIQAERRDRTVEMVRRLRFLKAIGDAGAWVLVMELFSWRHIKNRRELGALGGLVPTPYQSGSMDRDLGISKAGNGAVRALLIQLAWRWLRWQPHSRLSRWYHERFGQGGRRLRKIGIVALARKLLIALWRYVETGVVPEGAMLKAAV